MSVFYNLDAEDLLQHLEDFGEEVTYQDINTNLSTILIVLDIEGKSELSGAENSVVVAIAIISRVDIPEPVYDERIISNSYEWRVMKTVAQDINTTTVELHRDARAKFKK